MEPVRPALLQADMAMLLYDAGAGDSQLPPEFLRAGDSSWMKIPEARGAGLRIACGSGFGVLKHYRRGGWMAGLSVDQYLWAGLERSRPFREWRLLAQLHALGLPVPRPLVARVERRGWFYTGDLLTVELTGARPLADWLAVSPLDAGIWARIGAVIRRFHAARVEHADLNAHNIVLNPAGEVFLLDFDKGRLRTRQGRWQMHNLERLRRSLRKLEHLGKIRHWSDADFTQLLSAYRQEST